MEQSKSKPKYKTAAALRRVIEDRLAAERLDLAAHENRIGFIKARIGIILDLLDDADATGKEEGEDA